MIVVKPRVSRVRSKSFIFTLNDPTEDEIQYVQETSKICNFFIAGMAQAPTTGTPHVQNYFETDIRQTKSAAQTIIEKRTWIEVARGDHEKKHCILLKRWNGRCNP
jgi:hypothetical protein